MKDILNFLTALGLNNNREWFNDHKTEYQQCKSIFESFVNKYIDGLVKIDERITKIKASECVWRIYRDVRFSYDKRPYKEWFGAFVAPEKGKKSPMAGYYCHIQPNNCMFAAGIWGPEPKLLYHLRSDIADNYEELETIMQKKNFKAFFTDFDSDYTLKKVPAGFDPQHPHADWLKRKCYTISVPFSNEQVCAPDFLDYLLHVSKAAKPVNDFLNYSFEQLLTENS